MARKETVVEIGDYDEELYEEMKKMNAGMAKMQIALEDIIRLLSRSQISPS